MAAPKKPADEQPLLSGRNNGERKADVAKRKALFLKSYGELGTVRDAVRVVGITRGAYRRWMNDDPEFMRSVDEAKQEHGEYLEGLALERVTNPDKNRGSDVLLLALLNANLPQKYRPQVAMSEDSAKDLILEWRKAAKEVKAVPEGRLPAEVESEPLPTRVEQTLTELLEKRRDAPVKDVEDDDSHA